MEHQLVLLTWRGGQSSLPPVSESGVWTTPSGYKRERQWHVGFWQVMISFICWIVSLECVHLANHVVAVDPRLRFHGQAGIHVDHRRGNQVAFGVMEGEILYYNTANKSSSIGGESLYLW